VTDVVDGTAGAQSQTAAPNEVEGDTTYPVGNDGYPVGNDGDTTLVWVLDDLLSKGTDGALAAPEHSSQEQPRHGSVATLATPALDMPQAHAPRRDDTLPMLKVPSLKAPSPTVPSLKAPSLKAKDAKGQAPPQAPAPPQMVVNGLVLPTPPLDAEKYQYVRRHAWVITLLGAASFPLLLVSQVRMIFLFHWFWLYSPFLLLSLIFLALPMFTDAMSRGFNFKAHQKLVDSWHPTRYPSVDVFLPVCGEPIEVLRNTWKYVSLMSESYQGSVTAYVLDDSHNPQLKEMAAGFGFVYATRPNRGWFKKSGNLWFGYQVSYGEFIMLMDADFTPRHDFLNEVLPYMDADQKTGIVQTPQYFRVTDKQTWVERGGGAIQELFYRSIQSARAQKNGSICCGSCAVYRREALKDNVGMTLAEVAEDMLTGFDLKRLGWRLQYIPVAISTGNCPDNVLAFLNQQYRWCCGTVGLLFSKRFWSAKVPFYMRMCYLSGLVYYVYSALYTFMTPLLAIAILVFVPEMLSFRNMYYVIPVLIYGALLFPAWHRAPFRLEAWAVRLISGWAHFFAYWDAIRGRSIKWTPSGGKKQDGRRRFWVCFTVWSLGSSIAWTGLAFYRMETMDPVNFIVLFALGFLELMIALRVMIQPAADANA
jgi:cellulose synthase (UDP-forming)